MSTPTLVNYATYDDQLFTNVTIQQTLRVKTIVQTSGGSTILIDTNTFIVDATDQTKRLGFDVTGTTGTTTTLATSQTAARIVTLPDITGTVIVDAGVQTLSGAKTFTAATFTVAPATAGTVSIAGNAIASSVTVGNATGASSLTLRTGTAGLRYSRTVSNFTTAGDTTYTAAQMVGGILTRDPNGAGRTDTTPTAALLVAALPGVAVGDTIECYLINTADAAEAITLAAGTGVTISNVGQTVAQNEAALLVFNFTNVTAAAEAATLYIVGA